jgi:DMSO/TMAO reductase YedYZ molybdopterin-dependent catalytic subunit
MGNSRWKGARLKDILDRVGPAKEAIEIAFQGADGPALEKTPDFVKSIPVSKALDPDTIVAYEMNGQPLPSYNGAPARVVVPGWTATYWMKHVTRIDVRTKPEENFWMKSAYRIPVGKFPVVQRFLSQETPVNTPITEILVNSIIATPAAGDTVPAGQPFTVGGVAWTEATASPPSKSRLTREQHGRGRSLVAMRGAIPSASGPFARARSAPGRCPSWRARPTQLARPRRFD